MTLAKVRIMFKLLLPCTLGFLGIAMTINSSLVGAQETAQEASDWKKLLEPREYSDDNGATLRYRLLKPLDYHPNKKYPLVLFLHGAGERGDDNEAPLKHAIREFANETRRKENPCFVLVPQCPKDQKWVDVDWSAESGSMPKDPSVSMRLTMAVVANMVETSGVDRTRIYVTGLSMGGYGTWDALARYPEWIAAAAPICGGGDPETVSRFSSIPVWAFHGGNDMVVKPERSRAMIEALKKAGASPKYTEYDGVGHDSWSQTYADSEFHQWLFSHRRKQERSER